MRRELAVLIAVVAVLGCGRSRCDEIADEGRDVLRECGVRFGDFNRGPVPDENCNDEWVAYMECVLECYQSSPCSAFLHENESDYGAFTACVEAC